MQGNIKIYLALAILILWAHTLFTAHELVSEQSRSSASDAMKEVNSALRNRTGSFRRPIGLRLGDDLPSSFVVASVLSPPPPRGAATATAAAADVDGEFHIIFSTDCSAYQHWQSIMAFYSAKRVGSPPAASTAVLLTPDGLSPRSASGVSSRASRLAARPRRRPMWPLSTPACPPSSRLPEGWGVKAPIGHSPLFLLFGPLVLRLTCPALPLADSLYTRFQGG